MLTPIEYELRHQPIARAAGAARRSLPLLAEMLVDHPEALEVLERVIDA